MDSSNDAAGVILKLIDYLLACPLACDSSEGVGRWWLGMNRPDELALAQRALDRLAEEGIVERIAAADGRVRYRRAVAPAASDEALRCYSQRVRRERPN